GYTDDARSDPSSTVGNAFRLHLFVEALSLQPCNPTRRCRSRAMRGSMRIGNSRAAGLA
ncbi:hypothetical protein C8Q80DRAFT_1105944, partial [Daedaleopsis nitida]